MITIKKINLENFLSHKETEIEFNEDEKLLLEGKSGAGKSSILEAILWVFYGRGRVDNRNIIKKGAKNASVSIELDDDSTKYKITRKTSNKGTQTLDLSVLEGDNGEEVVKVEGLREKQDWIEKKLLKSSYILFINSILYLQDNVDTFVKQTAVKRKELLLEIANVENYDLYYNRAKEELKLSGEEKTRTETMIEEKKRIIENNIESASSLLELEKQEKSIEEKLNLATENINSIQAEYEKKRQLLSNLGNEKEKLNFIEKNIINIQDEIFKKHNELLKLKDIKKEDVEEGLRKLQEKKEQLSALEKEQQEVILHNDKIRFLIASKPREEDYDFKIASLNKQLIEIIKNNDTFCPSIGRECPKLAEKVKAQQSYYTEQIDEYQKKKKKQEEELKTYTLELEALGTMKEVPNTTLFRNEIKELEHWEQDKIRYGFIEEISSDLILLNLKIEGENTLKNATSSSCNNILKELSSYTLNYESLHNEFKNNLIALQAKKFQLAQELALAKKSAQILNETAGILSELEKKLISIASRLESLSLVKEAFGSKGIKTLIIDYIIPILENKINEILEQLSEFKIRLDTQRKASDGETMLEGLFINIFNDLGDEHDFDAFSGGEKLKIIIAISEALASLQKCSFRAFDESFTGLDEESTESFVSVLDKLKTSFKQIFCISHIRQIKDVFEDSIEIIKENGTSRVI